jgi:3-oxosteroid 1-dehydrogenase
MTDACSTSFDQTVDVLVAGSGAGAMTAALRAHDQGGRTLLIEKTDRYGGASAMSSCVLWIPNNHLMAAAGVDDSPEEAFEYLKATAGNVVSDERLRAYLDQAPRALQYLVERTHVRMAALPEYPDYYPRMPGSKPGARSIEPQHFDARRLGDDFLSMRDQNLQMQVMGRLAMTVSESRAMLTGQPGWLRLFLRLLFKYALDIPFRFKSKRDRNLAMGNAMIGMLRLSLMDRGIPLWLNTPARDLIVEAGRVVGILAEREGKPCRIRAERAVILAAGGFEGNQEMREKYLPSPTRSEWTCANPYNTGDVIQMGMKAGAGVDLMDDAWWGPITVAPGEDLARMFVIEKSLPGSVIVNTRGRRFINEAAPYIDVVNAMYAKDADGAQSLPAYLIFDSVFRHKYICGPLMQSSVQPDWMVKKLLKMGYLKRSETLKELAEQIDVEAAGLEATVAKMNEYARTGRALDFQRGDTVFDRYYGDADVQPNPCLAPIEKPPFYAFDVLPGELGTKGGLMVDARARVSTESGEIIPGLYAVGNCAASVMGRSYPGAGATIGPAVTFGYVAASDAMAD